MSEFCHNIYNGLGRKIGKPDGLSRRSGEETSGMEGTSFDDVQLLELREDESNTEGKADDIELEGIDVSKWDKRHELSLVSKEHGL